MRGILELDLTMLHRRFISRIALKVAKFRSWSATNNKASPICPSAWPRLICHCRTMPRRKEPRKVRVLRVASTCTIALFLKFGTCKWQNALFALVLRNFRFHTANSRCSCLRRCWIRDTVGGRNDDDAGSQHSSMFLRHYHWPSYWDDWWSFLTWSETRTFVFSPSRNLSMVFKSILLDCCSCTYRT